MHGGATGSGGPKGGRNGNFRHGRYTAETIALRAPSGWAGERRAHNHPKRAGWRRGHLAGRAVDKRTRKSPAGRRAEVPKRIWAGAQCVGPEPPDPCRARRHLPHIPQNEMRALNGGDVLYRPCSRMDAVWLAARADAGAFPPGVALRTQRGIRIEDSIILLGLPRSCCSKTGLPSPNLKSPHEICSRGCEIRAVTMRACWILFRCCNHHATCLRSRRICQRLPELAQLDLP